MFVLIIEKSRSYVWTSDLLIIMSFAFCAVQRDLWGHVLEFEKTKPNKFVPILTDLWPLKKNNMWHVCFNLVEQEEKIQMFFDDVWNLSKEMI